MSRVPPPLAELAPDLVPVLDHLLGQAHGPAGGRWVAAVAEEVRALHAGAPTPVAGDDPGELACREFARQMVFSVSALTEHDVDRLRAALGSDLAVYELVSSLWVLDLVGRAESAVSQVVGP